MKHSGELEIHTFFSPSPAAEPDTTHHTSSDKDKAYYQKAKLLLYDLFISYADFSDRQVFMTHIKFTKLTEDAGIQIPDLHLVLCKVKVLKFEEFLET